ASSTDASTMSADAEAEATGAASYRGVVRWEQAARSAKATRLRMEETRLGVFASPDDGVHQIMMNVHERVDRREIRRRPHRQLQHRLFAHEHVVERGRKPMKEEPAERERGDGEDSDTRPRRDVEVRRAFTIARFVALHQPDEIQIL